MSTTTLLCVIAMVLSGLAILICIWTIHISRKQARNSHYLYEQAAEVNRRTYETYEKLRKELW